MPAINRRRGIWLACWQHGWLAAKKLSRPNWSSIQRDHPNEAAQIKVLWETLRR